MNETPFLVLLIGSIFAHNLLLHYFLGVCPFLACSRSLATAAGLGGAVALVTTCTAVLNHLTYHYVLVPLGMEYLAMIVFVAMIAAFVQLLEMLLERLAPRLHSALGIFLPLTTVNCAILGVSLLGMIRDYSLAQSAGLALGGGIGWAMAIILMAGLRRRLESSDVPEPFRGVAISMVLAGVMAMAFLGFAGMLGV